MDNVVGEAGSFTQTMYKGYQAYLLACTKIGEPVIYLQKYLIPIAATTKMGASFLRKDIDTY